MSTIRVKKDGHYFAVSNVPFNDERLSWEARGVMGYLLSKPDNWTISRTDLIKRGDAGREKIQRILKELERCGYVTRTRCKKEDGTFYYETTITECPAVNGFAVHGSTAHGETVHIISTDLTNTELNKKDETIDAASALHLPPLRDGHKITRKHPAIFAIKQACGYYPNPVIYKDIVKLLGNIVTPEVQTKLNNAAKLWIAGGDTHSPTNYNAWLFDRFVTDNYYVAPNDKHILEYAAQ
jgi:hypothetical protein